MSPELTGPQPGLRLGVDVPEDGRPGCWVDDVEVLMGLPIGHLPGMSALTADRTRSPREAMEDVIRPALQRAPCAVTFSGGRDSSTVLAVATDLARREGLALPVPVTHRFPDVPDSDESDWQELVVRGLGIKDWQKLTWGDEMDALGPYAQRVLGQLGLGAPFNQHILLPVIDLVPGGSVLTGIGGDELFIFPLRRVLNRVLFRRGRSRTRDLIGALAQGAPRALRRRRMARSTGIDLAWLTHQGQDILGSRFADTFPQISARYDQALTKWWWRDRLNQVCREQLRRLGGATSVEVQNPFTAGPFLASVAGTYRAAGPAGRAAGLTSMVGDLLPTSLLTRTSKAGFDAAFARDTTREFAKTWGGGGVNTDLVRPEVLAELWQQPEPDARIFTLLQSAWLAENPQ